VSWRIAVEHQENRSSRRKPGGLGLRKSCTKEGHDVRESGLGDAHDGPWALDQDDAVASEGLGSVGVEENPSLGEASWETPFAKPSRLLRVDPATTIPQRIPLHIVEADGDSIFEKRGVPGRPGLEPHGGDRAYGLDALKKMALGIEGDGTCEGREGLHAGKRSGAGRLRGFRRGCFGDALEESGRFGIGAALDFSDELDGVPAATGGETAPQTAPEVNTESGPVVTTVEGTGSKELIAPTDEAVIETVVREDAADPDLFFEIPKRGDARSHFGSPPGRLGLSGVAVLAWRRSR
jgi:hypothetical protein